jgi:hypothetical protein
LPQKRPPLFKSGGLYHLWQNTRDPGNHVPEGHEAALPIAMRSFSASREAGSLPVSRLEKSPGFPDTLRPEAKK